MKVCVKNQKNQSVLFAIFNMESMLVDIRCINWINSIKIVRYLIMIIKDRLLNLNHRNKRLRFKWIKIKKL